MVNNRNAHLNHRKVLTDFFEKLPKSATQEEVKYGIHTTLSESGSRSWYIINPGWLDHLEINHPRQIYIGTGTPFPSIECRGYIVTFVRQKNIIIDEAIVCLQLLDLLTFFKKAPNTAIPSLLHKYTELLQNISREEKRMLVNLSRKYSPFVRTVLSLAMDAIYERNLSVRIADTLNPLTFKKHREKISL